MATQCEIREIGIEPVAGSATTGLSITAVVTDRQHIVNLKRKAAEAGVSLATLIARRIGGL